jgi:hypothetical protein
MAATNYLPEITEARQLYREGKQRESRDCLRDFRSSQRKQGRDIVAWREGELWAFQCG